MQAARPEVGRSLQHGGGDTRVEAGRARTKKCYVKNQQVLLCVLCTAPVFHPRWIRHVTPLLRSYHAGQRIRLCRGSLAGISLPARTGQFTTSRSTISQNLWLTGLPEVARVLPPQRSGPHRACYRRPAQSGRDPIYEPARSDGRPATPSYSLTFYVYSRSFGATEKGINAI